MRIKKATFGATAINSTTVEVKMAGPVAEVSASDFTIDGLTVSNAVVKQTDANTVVLTTSAQEGKEYTLKIKGETAGKFTGVSSVVPTDVDVVTASQQGVIGKEVTVSAKVVVADGQSKAGIPVTFNITNSEDENKTIEVEAFTNEDGVAEYSYTRYYDGVDSVVAYATSKSSVNDSARVYWDSALQLEVEEVTESNKLADGAKKVYKVSGAESSVVFVAFKENLGVKANQVEEDVTVTNALGYYDEDGDFTEQKVVTPYELSTGDAQYVAIALDEDGEGTFTLTGTDASVTPIVYNAKYDLVTNALNDDEIDADEIADEKGAGVYSALALQTQAPTVSFAQVATLAVDVDALGTEDAAAAKELPANGGTVDEDTDINLGGREYSVTVTDEDGELAPKGTKAYVTFNDDFDGDVQIVIGEVAYDVVEDDVYTVTVDKDGKASFRLIGQGSKAYATPTVFLNTYGDTGVDTALDKKDVQVEAETTYFTDAEVEEATLTVVDEDGDEVSSLVAGEDATVVYQSVDQNGFPYSSGRDYDVTFDLTTSFGEVIVYGSTQNNGRTQTYVDTQLVNGRAEVSFTARTATKVNVSISAANGILPVKNATVSFTYNDGIPSSLKAARITEFDAANNRLKLANADAMDGETAWITYTKGEFYAIDGEELTFYEFENVDREDQYVNFTRDADGKHVFKLVAAPDVTAPVEVTSLAFTDTDNEANKIGGTVAFTSSTSDDTDYYNVYLGTVLADTVDHTDESTPLTFAVAAGTTAVDTITVTAVDTAGNESAGVEVDVVDLGSATALDSINAAAASNSQTAWDNISPETFETAGISYVSDENFEEVVAALYTERRTHVGPFDTEEIQAIVFDASLSASNPTLANPNGSASAVVYVDNNGSAVTNLDGADFLFTLSGGQSVAGNATGVTVEHLGNGVYEVSFAQQFQINDTVTVTVDLTGGGTPATQVGTVDIGE